MENLLLNLSSYTNLTVRQFRPISTFFEEKSVASGTLLLRPGDKVQFIWKVGCGILRAFHHQEDFKHSWKSNKKEIIVREITSWIVPAPGFLTDITGFLQNQISHLYIEALEDCKLYRLSQDSYHQIQCLYPHLAASILEHSFIIADQKMQLLHLRQPLDRLKHLEQMHPGLSGKVSVKVLASYLNIDPSTLSKVRGLKD